MRYPDGPPPELPERFRGRPGARRRQVPRPGCRSLRRRPARPAPIAGRRPEARCRSTSGRCLFCGDCARACPPGAIAFTRDYRLAAAPTARTSWSAPASRALAAALERATLRRLFGRSLKLRQVSAGGCNACEADTNVLSTIGWDLGRFGIQFVASPRHADGLLDHRPGDRRTCGWRCEKTYDAVPAPKIVIAVGACAISGGPYVGHPEVHDGAAGMRARSTCSSPAARRTR